MPDAAPSVIILVADGIRPDTLAAALDGGHAPALARLRAEGALATVTSAFPSVTGPAYAPFILGRYPGPIGLPGLRWYDRARTTARFPHYTRSYMGSEMRHMDSDLDPAAPTIFELAGGGMTALSMIGRGLPNRAQIGRQLPFLARAARIHWTGDVRGWLGVDREIARRVVRHVRTSRPPVALAAFTGIDKMSHADGHDSPGVVEALAVVDDAAAELRHDAERDGRWSGMQLWVVSDHGHSPVHTHEDLAGLVAEQGFRTIAHPFIHSPRRPDLAVMVSGNAMAHLYLELERRSRPWWRELAGRWGALAELLLTRPSVDLLLLAVSPDECVVRSARGDAVVRRDAARGRYAYEPTTGDPLGLGGTHVSLGSDDAYAVCDGSAYPDAIVQIAHLAGSARAGEMVLSAAPGYDFRARFEPIPHRSSHGGLHRDHMLVPLLTSRPPARAPRRTVDVMPSALHVLGIAEPPGLDGTAFV